MNALLGPFVTVFSFSFLVALTGAMSPGPLLTYTIIRSANAKKRGYLMGLWIIAGHAAIEMAIIVILLAGFSYVLRNIYVMRIIGVAGGLILIGFGASVIRDVFKGRIATGFLEETDDEASGSDRPDRTIRTSPVVGGAMVSMSNPYWWVWWATIGMAFMLEFDITLTTGTKLAAFYLGHEFGDLLWYFIVSTLAFYGIRRLNAKVYYGILLLCGVFMVLFGCYLGASLFFRTQL